MNETNDFNSFDVSQVIDSDLAEGLDDFISGADTPAHSIDSGDGTQGFDGRHYEFPGYGLPPVMAQKADEAEDEADESEPLEELRNLGDPDQQQDFNTENYGIIDNSNRLDELNTGRGFTFPQQLGVDEDDIPEAVKQVPTALVNIIDTEPAHIPEIKRADKDLPWINSDDPEVWDEDDGIDACAS